MSNSLNTKKTEPKIKPKKDEVKVEKTPKNKSPKKERKKKKQSQEPDKTTPEYKDELNLSRQSKLVPENEINNYTFHVFGVGSIGSHFVECMAKTGFKNIIVYDMDTVEDENIAAQAYDFKHIGLNKVDAMAQIVKDGTGVDITTVHGAVTEDTEITPEPQHIYCCFFDSFEARKLVFNKVKDFPVVFIDGRIGRYDMRHYLVDLNKEAQASVYADTLEVGGVSDLECGEKASAPINRIISGKIVMNIVNYISQKDYTKIFIGNAAAPKNSIDIIEARVTPVQSEPSQTEVLEEPILAVADDTDEIEPETETQQLIMPDEIIEEESNETDN